MDALTSATGQSPRAGRAPSLLLALLLLAPVAAGPQWGYPPLLTGVERRLQYEQEQLRRFYRQPPPQEPFVHYHPREQGPVYQPQGQRRLSDAQPPLQLPTHEQPEPVHQHHQLRHAAGGVRTADAALHRMEPRQTLASQNSGDGGGIIFPDSGVSFRPRLSGSKPSCANDTTFCEDGVDQYPTRMLETTLAGLEENAVTYREFFGSDPDPGLSDRFAHDEGTLCDSQEKLVFPKVAQNADNQWMFIVNLDGDHRQGIRVEMCRTDGMKCKFSENFPAGQVAECRQKYIYRKLLAVTENGEPAPDTFRLPSCCACYVRSDLESRGNFGKQPQQQQQPPGRARPRPQGQPQPRAGRRR